MLCKQKMNFALKGKNVPNKKREALARLPSSARITVGGRARANFFDYLAAATVLTATV
jgi:hypothetical protein